MLLLPERKGLGAVDPSRVRKVSTWGLRGGGAGCIPQRK